VYSFVFIKMTLQTLNQTGLTIKVVECRLTNQIPDAELNGV